MYSSSLSDLKKSTAVDESLSKTSTGCSVPENTNITSRLNQQNEEPTSVYILFGWKTVEFYLLKFYFLIYMDNLTIRLQLIQDLNRWMVIRIWCFELFLSYIWIMSRKDNLIQIQIANNNNYSAVNTPVLAQGNPYTLDQLW